MKRRIRLDWSASLVQFASVIWLAVLLLLLFLFGGTLVGCTTLSGYQPRTADEAVRLAKEVGGTGCYYGRVSGNARPYADVEVRSLVVTTVGKGTSYKECLEAIPPEAKSVLAPQNN